jgi:hypothetical protein
VIVFRFLYQRQKCKKKKSRLLQCRSLELDLKDFVPWNFVSWFEVSELVDLQLGLKVLIGSARGLQLQKNSKGLGTEETDPLSKMVGSSVVLWLGALHLHAAGFAPPPLPCPACSTCSTSMCLCQYEVLSGRRD